MILLYGVSYKSVNMVQMFLAQTVNLRLWIDSFLYCKNVDSRMKREFFYKGDYDEKK